MAKVDGERGEDWVNDENENALIDMWQAKPSLELFEFGRVMSQLFD